MGRQIACRGRQTACQLGNSVLPDLPESASGFRGTFPAIAVRLSEMWQGFLVVK